MALSEIWLQASNRAVTAGNLKSRWAEISMSVGVLEVLTWQNLNVWLLFEHNQMYCLQSSLYDVLDRKNDCKQPKLIVWNVI